MFESNGVAPNVSFAIVWNISAVDRPDGMCSHTCQKGAVLIKVYRAKGTGVDGVEENSLWKKSRGSVTKEGLIIERAEKRRAEC